MALPRELLPSYTYEDYKNWQGDWELVEGIPFALASPSVKHQRVLAKLVRFLDEQLEKCPGCEVLPATDYVVSEHTILRPDVSVVCNNRGEKIAVTPKIIFEIVSPSSAKMDEITKKAIYEREGVGYYALVYPELGKGKIFKLTSDGVYKKPVDLAGGEFSFDLGGCTLGLNFDNILEV